MFKSQPLIQHKFFILNIPAAFAISLHLSSISKHLFIYIQLSVYYYGSGSTSKVLGTAVLHLTAIGKFYLTE